MIDKIRELLFRIFKKDSFIGKMIDKFFTKEIISYIFFGVLTTAVNLFTFFVFKKLFISIGWDGVLNTLLTSAGWEKALEFSLTARITLTQTPLRGLQAFFSHSSQTSCLFLNPKAGDPQWQERNSQVSLAREFFHSLLKV